VFVHLIRSGWIGRPDKRTGRATKKNVGLPPAVEPIGRL